MPLRDGQSNIQIRDRDVELFLGLFESRIMTLAQASALHFDGKSEMAKKRVQKLKAAGYVGERERKPSEPSILHLGRVGYEELRARGLLEGYPPMGWERLEKRLRVSPATLRHELEVIDFKSAFVSAVRREPRLSVAEFCTWPTLISFEAYHPRGGRVTVRPDGFFRIQETDAADGVYEHACFIEVDRSTETLDTLVTKLQCYREWYRRGGFALRCGGPQEAFDSFPFRMLVTCRSTERRNNLAEKLLCSEPRITRQVWLATQAEAIGYPLNSIWITPSGYRECVTGTPYDVGRRAPLGRYWRRSDRETLIENKIVKRPLIESAPVPLSRSRIDHH